MSGTGLNRELLTPEGVVLPLVLATAGERVSAFLLDVVLIVAALVVFSLAAVGGLFTMASNLVAALWLVGFFLLRNFYFTFFELGARGATPGKRALGIRVAPQHGGRLGADAVLARNLVRELELFLPLVMLASQGTAAGGWLVLAGLGWSGLFLVFPLLNRDRMRVGDLLAGTWVVRAPRRRLLPDLSALPAADASPYGFTATQLGAYGIRELHVLEDVLRRADRATMAGVAERIARKIGWGAVDAPQPFLQAYYAALRRHLERGLLFGRRRKDKFDQR